MGHFLGHEIFDSTLGSAGFALVGDSLCINDSK